MKINIEYLYRLADEYPDYGNPPVPADGLRALLDALAAAEHRATRAEDRIRHLEETARVTVREALRAERERDEWRQTALDELGAALDLLEQIKVRDKRIEAVQELVDETLRLDAENPEQYPTSHGGYVSAMEDIADALDQ